MNFPLINPQTYAVIRRGAGSYVDGVWTEPSDTTFNILAGIQPLTGRELDLLDEQEGVLTRARLKMYSNADLRTAEQDSLTRPDLVVIDGINHEIHFTQNRTRYWLPTSHRKYILLESDDQTDLNP